MHSLLLTLLLAQAPGQVPARAPGDSTARARADSAIHAFLVEWGDAWARTQLRRPEPVLTPHDRGGRISAAHCHWIWTESRPIIEKYVIKGSVASQASCPMWYPEEAGPIDDWWPVEHFARDSGAIVQLRVGQSVMLLRRAATRFAWATDLGVGLLGRLHGDTVRATLLESRSPTNIRSVASFSARIGGTLVVDAPLPRGAALVGIELPGDTAHPAARTRFGIDVPDALMALRGRRALSQPLLFDPLGAGSRPLAAAAAVKRMYGTTTFARFARLGLYWEGYGYRASDTVNVEVHVVREDGPGILARAAGLVGLGGSSNTGITLRWRDAPGSVRAIQVLEGAVPVQMRSVVLDVSRLSPGRYHVTVSMNGVASPAREFVLH